MSILQFKSDFELDNSTARTVAIASLTSSYLAISIAIASLLIFFCLDSVLSQLPKLVIGCLILIFKQIHRFHRFAPPDTRSGLNTVDMFHKYSQWLI